MAGQRRESGEADVGHDERDEPDVGVVLVSVQGEGFWDEWGEEGRVEFSVEEGEVLPGLAHEGALVGPDLELGEGLKVVDHLSCYSGILTHGAIHAP